MERVGLLGGTFDPVHEGHLGLALAAREELQLQRVLLIPAAGPPHKPDAEVTSFYHRQKMLLLALQGVAGLEPCLIEGNLPIPSYTIDTLRVLQAGESHDIEYLFIIGEDAFADLLSWKSYGELLQRVSLVVARRHGCQPDPGRLERIALELGYTRFSHVWKARPGLKDIHFLQARPPEISSSAIRSLIADGQRDIAGVHPYVLAYALQHGLYRSADEGSIA